MTRLLVAILLFAAVFCEDKYIEKYVSPCPGAISSNSGKSTYNEFLNTTLQSFIKPLSWLNVVFKNSL